MYLSLSDKGWILYPCSQSQRQKAIPWWAAHICITYIYYIHIKVPPRISVTIRVQIKKIVTSSKSVRSQFTASSFNTEELAILKESVESNCCISSEICCSEILFACFRNKALYQPWAYKPNLLFFYCDYDIQYSVEERTKTLFGPQSPPPPPPPPPDVYPPFANKRSMQSLVTKPWVDVMIYNWGVLQKGHKKFKPKLNLR